MKFEIAFSFSIKINEHDLLSRTSWRRLQRIVKKRDGAVCQICGVYTPDGHVDHIKPLATGGTDAPDNLQWTCGLCNMSKGVSDPGAKNDSRKHIFQIEVKEADEIQIRNLAVNKDKFIELAQAVLNGRGLAVAEWTGTGGLFSRGQFERLRGDLMDRGLVRWSGKGKAQGCELTPVGRTFFEQVIQSE